MVLYDANIVYSKDGNIIKENMKNENIVPNIMNNNDAKIPQLGLGTYKLAERGMKLTILF